MRMQIFWRAPKTDHRSYSTLSNNATVNAKSIAIFLHTWSNFAQKEETLHQSNYAEVSAISHFPHTLVSLQKNVHNHSGATFEEFQIESIFIYPQRPNLRGKISPPVINPWNITTKKVDKNKRSFFVSDLKLFYTYCPDSVPTKVEQKEINTWEQWSSLHRCFLTWRFSSWQKGDFLCPDYLQEANPKIKNRFVLSTQKNRAAWVWLGSCFMCRKASEDLIDILPFEK